MSETFVASASGKLSIIKDPNAVLDYTVDWTDWLAASGSDTINSVAWAITGDDAILTVSNQSQTTLKATVWLAAGTVGKTYAVRCRITTTGNRIEDRTFYVKIKER